MSGPYRFAYDPDGRLYLAAQQPPPGTLLTYVTLDDASTPTGQAAYDALAAGNADWSWAAGQVAQRPVLQVGVTNSVVSGVPTRTLAISTYIPAGSGLSAPASCTLAVAGANQAVALDQAGAATLTVQLHPAVAADPHPVRLTADGCTGWSGNLGAADGATVNHQLVQTGASSWIVFPTTKGQLRRWLFGAQTDDQLLDTLTRVLHENYVMTSTLAQVVFAVLLPQATAGTWAPAALSADQQHALADIQANIIPHISQHLGTIYPAGGARDAAYADAVALASGQDQALAAYMQAIATIPNLT